MRKWGVAVSTPMLGGLCWWDRAEGGKQRPGYLSAHEDAVRGLHGLGL